MAEFWDLFRGDTSSWPDRFLYRDLIREFGQPVLDVGCGTGRLLLDYLSDGVDIDGVDNSPDMLALCREKAQKKGLNPSLYRQDMETLNLPRRYRTILIPSSSFQLIIDPAEAKAAMRRLHDHLLPEGVLIMPVSQGFEPATEDRWIQIGEKELEDGSVARRWIRTWIEPDGSLEHAENRYEVLKDGEVIRSETNRRSPATRAYTHDQMKKLYEGAGLTVVQLLKEFTREPSAAEDGFFTVIGVKETH